jgi:cell division septation protein DedD
MRAFVFFLALANLLFFVWTHGYLETGDPDASRAAGQLRAEQIRIVSNDQAPEEKRVRGEANPTPTEAPPLLPVAPPVASPVMPPGVTPREDVCFTLSDVPPNEADSLERLFAEKLPAFKLLRTAMPGNSSYWVHIPSFKTRREAETRVEYLKRSGIKEYFIMQESGDNFAISLGLFSTPGAADSTLAALKEKGVYSATISERPRKSTLSRIELLGPESRAGEMRQLLGQALPQAKPVVCARSAAQ